MANDALDSEIQKLESRLQALKKEKEKGQNEYTVIDGFVYRRVTDIREADLIFSNEGYWKKEGPAKSISTDKQLLVE